jgi:hypothetical protein
MRLPGPLRSRGRERSDFAVSMQSMLIEGFVVWIQDQGLHIVGQLEFEV